MGVLLVGGLAAWLGPTNAGVNPPIGGFVGLVLPRFTALASGIYEHNLYQSVGDYCLLPTFFTDQA